MRNMFSSTEEKRKVLWQRTVRKRKKSGTIAGPDDTCGAFEEMPV